MTIWMKFKGCQIVNLENGLKVLLIQLESPTNGKYGKPIRRTENGNPNFYSNYKNQKSYKIMYWKIGIGDVWMW